MTRRLLAPLVFLVVGCGSEQAEAPDRDARITLGLRSELRAGIDVSTLRARLTVGEQPEQELVITPDNGLQFPLEIDLGTYRGGERLSLSLEAFSGLSGSPPLLVRKAELSAVAGRHLLLPLRLEARCVSVGPTGQAGPTCTPEQTCIGGECRSPEVEPSTLKDYDADWPQSEADRCKPLDAGAPEVIVGKGQADFLALKPDEEVQVEAGPQGGHHVWVALRSRNLLQAGSLTTVRGVFPDLGWEVPEYRVIFALQPSEGGYCELSGLRFQVDTGGKAIEDLLGQLLELEVQVRDVGGSVGVGKSRVRLSESILR